MLHWLTILLENREFDASTPVSYTHLKLGSTSAFEELFARYKNLLRKYSVVNGVFDEDLYQEQCVLFVRCIEIFDVNR